MGDRAPIAVGGVGGSGTRVVAAILEEAGVWMGGDLNEAHDNLWFTLLFKHPDILGTSEQHFRQLVSLFRAAMSGDDIPAASDLALLDGLVTNGRPQHDAPWLKLRAESLRRAIAARHRSPAWGWKEPNTHIVADRLMVHIPAIRYIHVARSGLDMAFSANQNQLNLWGPAVLGGDHVANPRNSLKFWRWAHTRIFKIGREMGDRFLFIRFEDLCRDPARYVPSILAFAGLRSDQETIDRTIQLVEPPSSIGRYASRPLAQFDPDDVAYVRRLGFAE
jgi:hypothetical protein